MDQVTIDEHGRPEPPLESGEAATLRGFLTYQRATLKWKCGGLDDEQLRVTLPPTTMTLGGMLKHLAYVEDYWFTEVIGGEPEPEPWASGRPGGRARLGLEQRRAGFRRRAAGPVGRAGQPVRCHRAGTARPGRGRGAEQTALGLGGQGRVCLRWVLAHMIEEYARHNGHADLIRESIDGQTGE